MQVLISILGCEKDSPNHGITRLWMPKPNTNRVIENHVVDAFIFVGETQTEFPDDVIHLPEDDSNGTRKVRAIIKYALAQGYDFLFKCDVDTYVCVPRLLRSGFEKHSWVGGFGSPEIGAYGGSGYWLRRDVMRLLDEQGSDEGIERLHDEDRWVGGNLIRMGLTPFLDERYYSYSDIGPQPNNDLITSHWYAYRESFSGSVEPPPRLVFSSERFKSMKKYHDEAKNIT